MKDSRLYVALTAQFHSSGLTNVFAAFPSSKEAVTSSGCICRASWVLYRGCRYDAFLTPNGRLQEMSYFREESAIEHERERFGKYANYLSTLYLGRPHLRDEFVAQLHNQFFGHIDGVLSES